MLREKFIRIKKWFFPCRENNYQPPFLESNFLFYYFFFLIILRVVILPFYVYFPNNIFFAQVITSDLMNLTNKERELLDLNPLKENPQLERAAYLKAQDMLEKGYFGHKSPEGDLGWDWMKETGYDYERAGENLAIGFLDSEEVHEAWTSSFPHRKNLLNPQFQDVGIAVVKGSFQGNEATIAVQFFGSPKIEKFVEEELVTEKELIVKKEDIQGEYKEPEIAKEETERSDKGDKNNKKEEAVEATERTEMVESIHEIKEQGLQFGFLEFMVKKYDYIVENIIFYSLVFITLILFLEALVFLGLSLQREQALRPFLYPTLRTFFFMGASILLMLFNKEAALYLIPHQVRIYGF